MWKWKRANAGVPGRSTRFRVMPALVMAGLLVAAAAGAQPVIPLNPALGELPEGVAIDKPGNIWITVQTLCEVRRYTPAGEELMRVQLVAADRCIAANGLAVDATGNAYVAVGTKDEATHGVYIVEPTGAFSHIDGTGQIESPNALAWDHQNGTLYVTDMTGGAVWRIDRNGVELWLQDPALQGTLPPPAPIFPPDLRLGANGIAFRQSAVYVAVTWTPRLVRIPVDRDGSAGTPEVVVSPPAFFAMGVFALDGLALDVFGNFFAAAPSGSVVRISADGTDISKIAGPAEGVTASPLSLAFGTGKGDRQYLFVTINPSFGGVGSGVVRVFAGAPGQPIP